VLKHFKHISLFQIQITVQQGQFNTGPTCQTDSSQTPQSHKHEAPQQMDSSGSSPC
jgi:hypothetical protein